MPIIELLSVGLVGVFLAIYWVNLSKNNQQQRQLEDAFYRLLDTQNGSISLIQLAAASRVEPPLARQYLETQAQAFGAVLEVDAEGNTFYRFPKLRPNSE